MTDSLTLKYIYEINIEKHHSFESNSIFACETVINAVFRFMRYF